MMRSAGIKFLGSDSDELNECFTIGRAYYADISSAGNYFLRDDKGDEWVIDPDDDDFELMQ